MVLGIYGHKAGRVLLGILRLGIGIRVMDWKQSTYVSLISAFYVAIDIAIKLVFLRVLQSLSTHNRFDRI